MSAYQLLQLHRPQKMQLSKWQIKFSRYGFKSHCHKHTWFHEIVDLVISLIAREKVFVTENHDRTKQKI